MLQLGRYLTILSVGVLVALLLYIYLPSLYIIIFSSLLGIEDIIIGFPEGQGR